MSDEPAPSLDLDELVPVDKAYECPSLFRKRNMADSFERTLVEALAFKAANEKRLQSPGPDCEIKKRRVGDHDDSLTAAATSNLAAFLPDMIDTPPLGPISMEPNFMESILSASFPRPVAASAEFPG
jgi:hypothetical protein